MTDPKGESIQNTKCLPENMQAHCQIVSLAMQKIFVLVSKARPEMTKFPPNASNASNAANASQNTVLLLLRIATTVFKDGVALVHSSDLDWPEPRLVCLEFLQLLLERGEQIRHGRP